MTTADYNHGYIAALRTAQEVLLDHQKKECMRMQGFKVPADWVSSPVGATEPPSFPLGKPLSVSLRQHVWVGLAQDLCAKADTKGSLSWAALAAPLIAQADKEVEQQTKALDERCSTSISDLASDAAVLSTERDGLKVLWGQARADLSRARDEVATLRDQLSQWDRLRDVEKNKLTRAYRERNEAQIESGRLRAEVGRMTTYTDDVNGRLVAVPLATSYPETYRQLKEFAKSLLEKSRVFPAPVSYMAQQRRAKSLENIAEGIRDAIGYGAERLLLTQEANVCSRCGQPSGAPRCV